MWTDLHSKLPQGPDGNAGDWAVVVGRDDGALLGSTDTGHSLGGGGVNCLFEHFGFEHIATQLVVYKDTECM